MQGADYTQWHGLFEVAHRFYSEFIPELKEILEKAKHRGMAADAVAVEKRMNEILSSDMHRWYVGKMSPEERAARKKASDEFKSRYAQ
jgi:CTP synthase (UTP-ammonia lyase)